MVLSDSDRRDMHAAFVQYLSAHGMSDAAATVEAAIAEHGAFGDKPTSMESKWGSLVRLNRGLLAAEKKVRELQHETEVLRDPTKRAALAADALPVEPAKVTYSGHRDTLTSTAFSPVDQVLYSGSEDLSLIHI